ncbi:hypothetical protein EF910_02185 [Streptomyces sp. WAC07149]|nr:hypothetical protein EF910_02185 [Streptomyces sp. WAC07149]
MSPRREPREYVRCWSCRVNDHAHAPVTRASCPPPTARRPGSGRHPRRVRDGRDSRGGAPGGCASGAWAARSRSTTTPAGAAPGQPAPAEPAVPAHRQQAPARTSGRGR